MNYLEERDIKAMIPGKKQCPGTKRRKKGPRARFNKVIYKERTSVEQSIGYLKEYRRIATRYDKLTVNFLAMVKLAFVRRYFKNHLSETAYASPEK
ncbi:transposase [Catalinimonas alkaloidigena]|uniref:transposase n=1 Tax=Catalinimonas alkaloidigena TaxID=1075417 RepID=UPI0024064056|nr:transposase [Catalinimonas alkaloidigena]MDF9797783.1 transposase [Catalinimonas alkaloidigena]